MTDTEKVIDFYQKKSIQSFLLCIEIFNKPTIDYRLEGSTFFLCNAWELLLKGKLLSENKDLYYPEKNGISRTISLKDAVAKVMTNDKDPVRINLNVIIALRNQATHSVIPEFEIIYTPFLSFCVKSYADKLYDYFGIAILETKKMGHTYNPSTWKLKVGGSEVQSQPLLFIVSLKPT